MQLNDEQVTLIRSVAQAAADMIQCNCARECEGTCTHAEAERALTILNGAACADQGLQVPEQALAELGPVGASIEAAEAQKTRLIPVFVGAMDIKNYGGPRISVGTTEQQVLDDMAEFLYDEEDQDIQALLKAGDIRSALEVAEERGIIRGWSISEEGGHSIEVPA